MPETVSHASETTRCPQCRSELAVLRTASWCPECEWNLNRYDPDRHARPFGWAWLDRLAYRTAYRLNARQFAVLAKSDLAATRARLARASVIVICAVLLALILAMFIGGSP